MTTTTAERPGRSVLRAIGARLGCTDGQVQTLAIGLSLAVLVGALGLPPVLREHPAAAAGAHGGALGAGDDEGKQQGRHEPAHRGVHGCSGKGNCCSDETAPGPASCIHAH